jgi:hypothetical protein
MKSNLIIYLSLFLFFVGCSKDDGPVPKSVGVERIPAPLITKDASGNATINFANPTSFSGKYNVGLYFPNDAPPSKMDIVIRKNGDNATVKVLQANVTTFPSSFTITGAQLVSLYGAIASSDSYEIGADVYTASGKKYEAFPAVGNGYGATGFTSDHPGFSPSVTYGVSCPTFIQSVFTGKFKVVTDTWQDFAVGEALDVVPGPAANQLTIYAYPSPAYGTNRKGIVINVSADQVVTIPEQIIGDYDAGGGAFDKDITIQGGGTVNSCNKTISLTGLRFKKGMGGAAYGSGPYTLTIKQ